MKVQCGAWHHMLHAQDSAEMYCTSCGVRISYHDLRNHEFNGATERGLLVNVELAKLRGVLSFSEDGGEISIVDD